VPHCVAHSSNLAVAALVDCEAENSGTDQRSLGWRGEPIIEFHALPEEPQFAACWFTFDMGDVFLLDTKRWMCESMSEISIVGKQQETFGIHIKAADGKDARFLRNKFENGRTTMRIIGGRDHASRFIQQEMHKSWTNTDDDSVDCDHVLVSIDTTAQYCYLTINGDCAISN
jgi:hypothetical protein